MARPLRIQGEGCVYHVTARGDRRKTIFRDDVDCERFCGRLVESLSRFNVELHAWVLMGNHFHLLARTREANLSRWMQWLMGCTTMDFNRRHGQCGHLFQGRYKALLVEERGYFAELGRYIHLNPVRGEALGKGELPGRRARLRAFRWSSFRAYAGLERAPSWLRTRESYAELGLERAKDRRVRYRRFVERGLADEIEDPRRAAQAQVVLGSESFLRRVKDRLRELREQDVALDDVVKGGLARSRRRGMELLEETAVREGLGLEAFCARRRYGDVVKAEAMKRLQKEAGWSLREIGEQLGGLKPAAVSQRIRQWKHKLSNV